MMASPNHPPGPVTNRQRACGAAQHLTRIIGRARALEIVLSAEDYDAELAARYGWANKGLPADVLGGFVRSLAHQIASFPSAGHIAAKDRVEAIALARLVGDLADGGSNK